MVGIAEWGTDTLVGIGSLAVKGTGLAVDQKITELDRLSGGVLSRNIGYAQGAHVRMQERRETVANLAEKGWELGKQGVDIAEQKLDAYKQTPGLIVKDINKGVDYVGGAIANQYDKSKQGYLTADLYRHKDEGKVVAEIVTTVFPPLAATKAAKGAKVLDTVADIATDVNKGARVLGEATELGKDAHRLSEATTSSKTDDAARLAQEAKQAESVAAKTGEATPTAKAESVVEGKMVDVPYAAKGRVVEETLEHGKSAEPPFKLKRSRGRSEPAEDVSIQQPLKKGEITENLRRQLLKTPCMQIFLSWGTIFRLLRAK